MVVSSETPTIRVDHLVEAALVLADRLLDRREHALELGVVGRRRVGHRRLVLRVLLELLALVDEEGRVAAVVDDLVHPRAVRPRQRLVRAPPVLLERLALPREDGAAEVARAHDGRRGVVLRREDVARAPADVAAELLERLDEHGRLDRHVSGDGGPNSVRDAIRPGISASARSSSFRPKSASEMSATLKSPELSTALVQGHVCFGFFVLRKRWTRGLALAVAR